MRTRGANTADGGHTARRGHGGRRLWLRRSTKLQREGGWSKPLSHGGTVGPRDPRRQKGGRCIRGGEDRGPRRNGHVGCGGYRKRARGGTRGRGVTVVSVTAVTEEGVRRHARARRNGHVGCGSYRTRGTGGPNNGLLNINETVPLQSGEGKVK